MKKTKLIWYLLTIIPIALIIFGYLYPSSFFSSQDSIREFINSWGILAPIAFILLQILHNRGLVEAADIQAFLEGRYLESTDPFLLPDMEKAVARIKQAIEADELIVVYGDFAVQRHYFVVSGNDDRVDFQKGAIFLFEGAI